MRQHPAGAGDRIDGPARRGDLVVRQKTGIFVVHGRAGQYRHIRIAVDINFLDVIGELQAIQRDLAFHVGIPVRFCPLGETGYVCLIIVAHEMRLAIENELPGEFTGALMRRARARCLGFCHLVDRTKHVVHRDKGGRHAGRRCEKLPATHAVVFAEMIGKLLDPYLDLFLLGSLRRWIELAVGNHLRRYR